MTSSTAAPKTSLATNTLSMPIRGSMPSEAAPRRATPTRRPLPRTARTHAHAQTANVAGPRGTRAALPVLWRAPAEQRPHHPCMRAHARAVAVPCGTGNAPPVQCARGLRGTAATVRTTAGCDHARKRPQPTDLGLKGNGVVAGSGSNHTCGVARATPATLCNYLFSCEVMRHCPAHCRASHGGPLQPVHCAPRDSSPRCLLRRGGVSGFDATKPSW